MFTGPVGPVEVIFYWPEAVLGDFYWPGAIGLLLAYLETFSEGNILTRMSSNVYWPCRTS